MLYSKQMNTQGCEEMIKTQLLARGIKDPHVLAAFRKVKRDAFVPAELKAKAYEDSPLAIGLDQTISQPFIVAYMSQAAEIKPQDKILEIGTGSGFQTAILAELAKDVYSIERLESLGLEAKQKLKQMGYKNIHLKIEDGHFGWEEAGPFDVIIVTAAPEHLPHPLLEQMNIGGRMIIPVGGENQQRLLKVIRTERGFHEEVLMPVRFVPFISPH